MGRTAGSVVGTCANHASQSDPTNTCDRLSSILDDGGTLTAAAVNVPVCLDCGACATCGPSLLAAKNAKCTPVARWPSVDASSLDIVSKYVRRANGKVLVWKFCAWSLEACDMNAGQHSTKNASNTVTCVSGAAQNITRITEINHTYGVMMCGVLARPSIVVVTAVPCRIEPLTGPR